jgi:cytochrome c553
MLPPRLAWPGPALARGLWLCLALLLTPTSRAQGPEPFADTVAQRAKACTGCHGPQGRASPEGYVPRLAGKPAQYLFEQTQAFRDGRRAHKGMAQLLHNVDDALLRELAAHFAGQDLPYPPPARTPLPADRAERAQRIVREGLPAAGVPACAGCHGDALMGDGDRVPALLGLPRDYLVGQIGAWRQGHRRAREPDCMAEVARRLPAADLALVADWLAAQPATPVPTAGAGSAPAATAAVATDLACAETPPPEAAAPPVTDSDPRVARGAYLARVGHCAGCHQRPGTRELSGGPGLVTPFGTVYAGNLTPDPATGLGGWSADDFWRAMHQGRGRDGRRLLPAFPYTAYTRVTRADSDALFAYLQSLPPVRRQRPDHALRFPYGTQAALALWQALYFRPGGSDDGPAADPQVARGRYLVEGLGHCLECHAPRGRLGAHDGRPVGGLMPGGDWWAPSLQPAPGQTADDLVALLRDGRNRHASATGPMAAVVSGSTQHWRDEDLRAAAAYLMTLPPQAPSKAVRHEADPSRRALGRQVYERHCASCHGAQGQGVAGSHGRPAVAPLAGNPAVTQPQLHSLVRMLRHGGFGAGTAAHPRPFGMPPLTMSVAEEAAVLTHLRQSWGHRAPEVTEVDLLTLR